MKHKTSLILLFPFLLAPTMGHSQTPAPTIDAEGIRVELIKQRTDDAKTALSSYSIPQLKNEPLACKNEEGWARFGCRIHYLSTLAKSYSPINPRHNAQEIGGFWERLEKFCPGPSGAGKWICYGTSVANMAQTGYPGGTPGAISPLVEAPQKTTAEPKTQTPQATQANSGAVEQKNSDTPKQSK